MGQGERRGWGRRGLVALGMAGLMTLVPGTASKAAQQETPEVRASASGSYLAGWYAQRIEEWGAAAQYLHRAHEIDPDEARLMHRAFLLRLADGRVGESLGLAERISEEPQPSTLAQLVLMLHGLQRGDVDAAKAYLHEVPETGIGQYVEPLIRAWFQSEAGEVDHAVATLEPLGSSSGFKVLKDLHAGEILSRAGRADAAQAAFEAALEASGQSLRVVLAATRFLVQTGQIDQAVALLSTVEQGYPPDISVRPLINRVAAGDMPAVMAHRTLREGIAEALFDIASAFIQERSELVGTIYLQAALYANPAFPLARMQLADVLADSGQEAAAMEAYRSVLTDPGLRYSAGLHLADTLYQTDRTDEARALLEDLASDYPERLNPLFRIANLERQGQRWTEAVTAYDRALERPPATEAALKWRLLYGRAMARDQMKDWPGAEADLLAALEVDPDQPDLLNYLGYSWADQGVHLARAKEMITRAVAHRPRNGYIVDSLGWVEFRLGNLEAAVRELERAIELQPADPTINDHLGDVYWAVGRRLEAIYQWRRALRFVGEDDGDLARAVEQKLQEHEWQAEGLQRAGAAANRRS